MAYQLEGRMLEVCTCNTICPCFVNDKPDGDSCEVTVAWHVDKGSVEGVDVTGRTIAVIARLPGRPLDGGWRAAVYLDDATSDVQQEALLKVFTGQLGGAVADIAKLVGEVVGVERAPIAFSSNNGKASLKVGTVADTETELLKDAKGQVATLTNTVFSGAPGSPTLLGRALHYRAKQPVVGVNVDLAGHSAVEATFRFHG